MSMYGVGETYGPQLIAEIGDVSRFTHREAITAFAGVDPGVNESGQFKQRSNRASKNGSTRLRKTLFQVMSTYLQNKPVNEPVYQFLDRKRAGGKPYLVHMTAGANKFLRIYYEKVKECLRNLEQSQIEELKYQTIITSVKLAVLGSLFLVPIFQFLNFFKKYLTFY